MTQQSAVARSVSQAKLQGPARVWQYRNGLLICLDVAVIWAAFAFAYHLRFHREFLAIKQVPVPDSGPYGGAAILLSLLWVGLMWRRGAYEPGLLGITTPLLGMQSLVIGGCYALLTLMALSFMVRDLLLSRQVSLMVFGFASLGMMTTRTLLHAAERYLSKWGVVCNRVLVVGEDEYAQEFANVLKRNGRVAVAAQLFWSKENSLAQGFDFSGGMDGFIRQYEEFRFNTIVFSFSDCPAFTLDALKRRIPELLNFCELYGVTVYIIPHSFDIAVSPQEVGSLHGIPLIQLRDACIHPGYAVIKRLTDVVIATIVLILGTPLWAIIAVLIKLDSKGPIFFTQVRAGLHGRPFCLYKFRSMQADAELRLAELVDIHSLDEPVFKIKSDPRVTRLGAFLRSTGLDEIPQLINVVKGEMSIVGPRPEEISMVMRYNPSQQRRLKAKPGITGYQQINNRGEPSLSRRVKYDLAYLKQQSFLLDLYIIGKTVSVVMKGSGIH